MIEVEFGWGGEVSGWVGYVQSHNPVNPNSVELSRGCFEWGGDNKEELSSSNTDLFIFFAKAEPAATVPTVF